MKQFLTGLSFCLATIAGFAQCTGDLNLNATLAASADADASVYMSIELQTVTVDLDWSANGFGPYPSDVLMYVYAPDGSCAVWGGWNVDADAACTDLGTGLGGLWPDVWNSGTAGTYTATIDVSSAGLIGAGDWTVVIINAYATSSGANYDFNLTFDGPCAGDCPDPTACNYVAEEDQVNPLEEVCLYPEDLFGVGYDCDGVCLGDEDGDGICDEADDCFGSLDECGVCEGAGTIGCTDDMACNYNTEADCDDGGCQYLDACGECGGNGDACAGCTIELACNYDPFALSDDGSCEFFCPGCLDDTACNYDSTAIQDGGGCLYPEDLGTCDCNGNVLDSCGVCGGAGIPEGDCDCDGNQLDALAVCGGACSLDVDADGICDDVDDCVGELDALGVCGGYCAEDADADGICDDEDECVGALDACGICNGPGEIYECGCEDIPAGDCDCDGNSLDQCGVCGGDGISCVGCTYPEACNYDASASILDASICEFGTCPGCTIVSACNYNPTVSIDDGSCSWCECLETLEISVDEPGDYSLTIEASPAVQEGFTTYRFYVDMNDATDLMSAVYGDSSDTLIISTPNGVFNHPLGSSTLPNPALFAFYPELVDDSFVAIGSTNPPSIIDQNGNLENYFNTNGEVLLEFNDDVGGVWYVLSDDPNSLPDSDLRVFILQVSTIGSISGVLNYQVLPLNNTFSNDPVRRTITFDGMGTFGGLVSGTETVFTGCTDNSAVNYCSNAELDDGSCIYEYTGCTDQAACNYSDLATYDDGAQCIYAEEGTCDCEGNVLDECGVCGGEGIAEGDCDCEGNVLDECGVCGGDGIPEGFCDCNGSVLDECGVCGGDGIAEGACDCEGNVLDECGVCGGEGIPEGQCDCEGNQLDAIGICGGDCVIDQNNNGICDLEELESGLCGPESCGPGTAWDEETQACIVAYPADINFDGCVQLNDLLDLLQAYGNCAEVAEESWLCGDHVSYQGYDYATVQIGEQCWFAENLRIESYENGDAIPAGLNSSEWTSTTSGATVIYDGNASNLEAHGRLYNWHAVDDARSLCPSTWRIPSDGDWTTLTNFLGGAAVAGGQMKTTYGWNGDGNGTNSSGFSGLPGGSFASNGNFNLGGSSGYWWSASPYGSSAWYRIVSYNDDAVTRNFAYQRNGYSVRCLRDAE